MFQSQDVDNQAQQSQDTQTKNRVKSVLRYTMMPEIIPRIRAIGFHFGHFAYLLALVFASARLIPSTHPVLNAVNIGHYTVRQVIALAANNITWSWKNIDQVAIFSAIIIGIIMIVIQAVLIAVAALLGADPASAAAPTSFFSPGGTYVAADDPMMIFFAQVFGDLNGFWGHDFTVGDTVFGTKTSIHEGLYAMLSLYSMAMMVIAVIIVLYYIMTVVGEAAKTGTPFGNRFNSLWAPIRLVIALGLLVPLGSGLNSAQYMTLWIAKMGAGLGTQVWGIMHDKMLNPDPDRYIVGDFQRDWVHEAAYKIFFLETCMYASNKENYNDPMYAEGITRRVVEDSNTDDSRVFKVFYDKPSGFTTGITYRSCGEITIDVQQYVDSIILERNSLSVADGYTLATDIIKNLMGPLNSNETGGKAIPLSAVGLARENVSIGGSIPAGSFYYDNVKMFADNVKNSRFASFSTSGFDTKAQEVMQELFDKSKNSFIYAGVWYLEISRIIQQSKDIMENSVPNFNLVTSDIRGDVRNRNGNTLGQHFYAIHVGSETEALLGLLWRDLAARINEYNVADPDFPQECRNLGADPSWWVSTACAVSSMIIPDELTILAADNPDTRTLDPMATLVSAGYSIFQKGWWFIGTGLVASAAGGILGAFGPLMSVIGNVASALGSIAILIGALGLTAGFVLYFLLPVLPFIYFFFAVVSWVMEIFEAVLAMPLWALAHLSIDGEGMPGQAAMSGYYLLLAILLRPALIVIGLVAGALIFGAAIFMLQSLFDNVLLIKGTANSNGLENLFYSLIFAYIAYSAGVTSFKLVDNIPNQILRWIGNSSPTFSDGKEDALGGNQQLMAAAGGFVGSSLGQSLSQGASGAGQGVGKGLHGKFSKEGKASEATAAMGAANTKADFDRNQTGGRNAGGGDKPKDTSPLRDPRDD